MTKRWLARVSCSALALGLAACSTGLGGTTVCPCAVTNALTIRYTGSFVQNGAQLPTPIAFTATNETATVTVTTGATPAANLSVAFTAACNAATLGTPTAAGTFTVTSMMSGSCTIAITSSNGTATAGVSVP